MPSPISPGGRVSLTGPNRDDSFALTTPGPAIIMRTSKQENLRSAMTRGIETLNGLPTNRRTGYGVGTLLGCVPGISRPAPPTVLVSSGPNCGDCDHDRPGPSPVTLRQPDSWTPTGRKP